MSIIVIAQIHSKPEFNASVQIALQHLVEQTRKEPACKAYDLLQNATDPDHFTMYEVWESESGFEKHNEMNYIKTFIIISKNWLSQSMVVSTYSLVETV
jgi:quinol monooxygenase YgiN